MLDAIDTAGLHESLLREVPEEIQSAVAADDPKVRVIWNPPLRRFQLVYRNPGNVLRWPSCVFTKGWEVLSFEFTKAELSKDRVLSTMRQWRGFNEDIRAAGFASMDEWVDARIEQLAAQGVADEDAMFDAFFGTEHSLIKYGSSQTVAGWGPRVVRPRNRKILLPRRAR